MYVAIPKQKKIRANWYETRSKQELCRQTQNDNNNSIERDCPSPPFGHASSRQAHKLYKVGEKARVIQPTTKAALKPSTSLKIQPETTKKLPANPPSQPSETKTSLLWPEKISREASDVARSIAPLRTSQTRGSEQHPRELKLNRSVVKRCQRKVPANSDCRGLPADVCELIRAKNAALRRASAYPISEYRPRARALHREVKARVREVKNDNWSTLMEEITPNYKAYWAVAKALKSDVIKLQCLLNPPSNFEHVSRVENEVLRRSSLPPKDDLPSASADEIQKLIKELKPRKAPGLDELNTSRRALKRLIRAGVPQDFTFSPLLYSAYTNDIPRPQTGVQLVFFADDTALYLHDSNFRQITPSLQKAIDKLTR
ncbi:hypothetical protein EVAR_98161_1 [Eumeta japonica]|uniref:RNA-directed DNA polymerase from transposon BS n=1 Tax=Eumeta variegata TaxID=151549 RepID=A0A4C1YF65_EUMVA|nr:hypothetical protein EVAR_98161_1 [Eumeta japonica]